MDVANVDVARVTHTHVDVANVDVERVTHIHTWMWQMWMWRG